MDTDLKREYRLKMLCNAPIEFYGREIKVPSVKDIATLGNSSYSHKILIFTLTDDFAVDLGNRKLSLFTTLCIVEDYRRRLMDGICYFLNLKPSEIKLDIKVFGDEQGFETFSPIISFPNGFINEHRFKELKELVLLVTNNEEQKVKKEEKISSKIKPEYAESFKRYLEGKAKYESEKKQKENGLEMFKMITYLATKTKHTLDYITNLNLEQFNTLFLGELCEEKNLFELTKLSTGVIMSKDLDLKTLFERIKLAIK